jgi:hypothetical protein
MGKPFSRPVSSACRIAVWVSVINNVLSEEKPLKTF